MVEDHILNLQPGTVIAGRYEVIKCLGSGSMGLVYASRDRELPGRIVAIKALYPEVSSDEVSLARFRNEIVASYGVSHPNVIRSYELIKDGDLIAYSMEYVEGGVLLDYIEAKQRPDLNFSIKILIEMCAGVQAIHDAGIVHRDLKPENILITKDGSVKIADFGIARTHHGPKLTEHGSVVGTIDYVSPEYMLESKVDWRSDIYAMGILSYELITGKAPFEAESVYAMMTKRLSSDPVAPSNIRQECSKELDRIILKAMARDIEQRYQSASEMGSDLILLYQGSQPLQTSAIKMQVNTPKNFEGPKVNLGPIPKEDLVDPTTLQDTIIKKDINNNFNSALTFTPAKFSSKDEKNNVSQNQNEDTQEIKPEIIDIATYYTLKAEELKSEKLESVLSRGAVSRSSYEANVVSTLPKVNSVSISKERIGQLRSKASAIKQRKLSEQILVTGLSLIAIIFGIFGGYYLANLIPEKLNNSHDEIVVLESNSGELKDDLATNGKIIDNEN